MQTDDFVDLRLPKVNSYPTIEDGNDTWETEYRHLIHEPQRVTDHIGNPVFITFAGWTYPKYDGCPYIYYVILSNKAENSVFYGLLTTGYNRIEALSDRDFYKKRHPKTKVKLFYGTIVHADGTREDYRLYRERDLKAKSIKTPVGCRYVRNGFPEFKEDNYETVAFTFERNGKGTIFCTQKPYYEYFSPYMGGELKQKVGNRVKRRGNVVMGGTLGWQHSALLNMKWTYTDGKLTITPTGNASMAYKEWIKDDDENTHYTSESDRRYANRQQENDLKYLNEDAIAGRERYKKSSKEAAEKFPEVTIDVKYLTAEELVGTMNGKPVHLTSKTQSPGDIYDKEVFEKLDYWKQVANDKREKGISRDYESLVRRTKTAVLRDKERFGETPDYTVGNYTFGEDGSVSAVMKYYKPNEMWEGTYHIEKNGTLVMDATKVDPLAPGAQEIETLNTAVMAYKKDKARQEVVKKYEKSYKNFIKKFKPVFSSEATLNQLLRQQTTFIDSQKETLKLLE